MRKFRGSPRSKPRQVAGEDAGDAVEGNLGDPGVVRREHHPGVGQQGRVRRRRLRTDRVESGRVQPAGVEGLEQCRLVDHPAAAHVHERRTRLEPGEAGTVEEAAGRRAQRHGDHHEVRVGNELVEAVHAADPREAHFHAVLVGAVAPHACQPHVEGGETAGDRLADRAEADEPSPLAGKPEIERHVPVPDSSRQPRSAQARQAGAGEG
jgi:hypothetical protein